MKQCKHGRYIDKCSTCIIDDLEYTIAVLTKQNKSYESTLEWQKDRLEAAYDSISIINKAAVKAENTIIRLKESKDRLIAMLEDLDTPEQPRPGCIRS